MDKWRVCDVNTGYEKFKRMQKESRKPDFWKNSTATDVTVNGSGLGSDEAEYFHSARNEQHNLEVQRSHVSNTRMSTNPFINTNPSIQSTNPFIESTNPFIDTYEDARYFSHNNNNDNFRTDDGTNERYYIPTRFNDHLENRRNFGNDVAHGYNVRFDLDRQPYNNDQKQRNFSEQTRPTYGLDAVRHNRIPIIHGYMHHRVDFGELVPDFDPPRSSQSAEKWLQNIEDLAVIYATDDLVLLHHAIRKLKGAAKFWFEGLARKENLDWSVFKRNLVHAFPAFKDEADVHFTLMQRTQGSKESLEEYFFEMISIGRRGKFGDESIMKYIIMGLNSEDLKRTLLTTQTKTLDELLGRIKWAESMKCQNSARNQRQNFTSSHNSSNSYTRNTDQQRTPPKCYNCNEIGHISRYCTEKQRLPRCSNCNKVGHEKEKCYTNKTDNKPTTTTSIRHIMEEDIAGVSSKPFHLKIYFGSNSVFALIDTGSPINIVKRMHLPTESQLMKPSDHLTYSGINKSPFAILGIVTLQILIEKIKLNVRFHVVDDNTTNVDCVLGGEFMKDSNINVVIDGSSGKTVVTCLSKTRAQLECEKRRMELTDICLLNGDTEVDQNVDVGDDDTTYLDNEQILQTFKHFKKTAEPEKPEVEHTMIISVTNEHPFYFPPRRYSFQEQREIDQLVQDLLEKGTISESRSPYASRIVLQKKRDGTKRMCIDFRELNKRTVRDVHPIPLIDDQLDQLRGKRFFSLIDLKSGFHHINLHENSRKYTAFVTATGQYEYNRVPFGLCNGPAVFTRFINHALRSLIRDGKVLVYVDDIMVGTDTVETHNTVLGELFEVLRRNKLQINLQKCHFLKTKIDFLGYNVSELGIKPSGRHIEAVSNFPIPKNVHELYRFIGLTSFFRRFIKNHSILAKPLYDLLRKGTPFVFGESQMSAFEMLKVQLVTEPVLRIYDTKSETELHTDASALGFGGCLLQKQTDDGQFHPVMFFSKRSTDAESRYHSFELETLAVVYSLKRFHVYLHGLKFTIVTDCNSLKQTLAKQELNPRISRWALELQNYDYEIVHRESRRMQHVDALSRNLNIMVLEEGSFEQTLALHQIKDETIKALKIKLQKSKDKHFELKDGLVYRKKDERLMFYVPEAMQSSILKKYHDEVGHTGVDKVFEMITRVYWFPELRLKIKSHIDNCLKCITFNPKSGRKEGFLHPIDKGIVPFHTIHIDHLGPLEETPRGYKYILLITDAFSKFVKLYPTKTTSSINAINCLKKYFQELSCPIRIISDRGTSFTSKIFKKFVDENRVTHTLTATASPQSNGQVERMNRFLVPIVSKLVNHSKNVTWDKVIPETEHAINNTINKSIGTTPSKALYGVNQRLSNDDLVRNYLEEAQGNIRNLDRIRLDVHEENCRAQDQYKAQYDKKRKSPRKYKVGDFVMIVNIVTSAGVNHKLLPKYKGPYIITKILQNDRYIVSDIAGFQQSRCKYKGVFGPTNLKPWMDGTQGSVDDTDDEQDGDVLSGELSDTEQ